MVRTQIQLPDEVHVRAKRICQAREISFAELTRRGIEYILGVYAEGAGHLDDWQPPTPRRLGWKGLSDEQIKVQAQATLSEVALSSRILK
jgi:hypothetical protein